MYQNRVDHQSNNEIKSLFPILLQNEQKPIRSSCRNNYALINTSKILNLKLGGKSLVTRRFKLHLNSRGVDEIRDLPILLVFGT